MKYTKLLIHGALLFAPLAGVTQATYFIEYNKTISRLGAQENIYYVDFVEPFGQVCEHGVAYIAADKKGLYVQLLAAKLSGKRLSRVDYDQPGGNGTACALHLAEIVN